MKKMSFALAILAGFLAFAAAPARAATEVLVFSTSGGTTSIENLANRWSTIKEFELTVPASRPAQVKIVTTAYYTGATRTNYFRTALRDSGTSYYTGPWRVTSSAKTLTKSAVTYTDYLNLPYASGVRFILDTQGYTPNQYSTTPPASRSVIYNTYIAVYWVYP